MANGQHGSAARAFNGPMLLAGLNQNLAQVSTRSSLPYRSLAGSRPWTLGRCLLAK